MCVYVRCSQRVTTPFERAARKIFLRRDSHFSRLTVVEGRGDNSHGSPLSGVCSPAATARAPLSFLSLVGWQKSWSGRLVISHFPKQRHRQALRAGIRSFSFERGLRLVARLPCVSHSLFVYSFPLWRSSFHQRAVPFLLCQPRALPLLCTGHPQRSF